MVATKTVNGFIAEELGVSEGQVAAAVELLDGGYIVPFVARYRRHEEAGTDLHRAARLSG